ncbi:tautomerase family protein [Streptomyces sp. GMR22]|uniref:tautomerase family protein n=1 Tax=Streptomyces sp. GMR22 TaxID=2759524 RepID=UPI0015FAFCDA|nr:tautomerase family protein [Streptomyces sp. GMR22]MBA6435168.1 tautomerase family protein [Streptomyces sp. GMR22]
MPLVNIYLREGTTPEYRRNVSLGIHRSMVDVLKVPQDDRFHLRVRGARPGGGATGSPPLPGRCAGYRPTSRPRMSSSDSRRISSRALPSATATTGGRPTRL